MTKPIVVTLEQARGILADPVFNERLGNARTWVEVERVLKEFTQKKAQK